jgi:UDP-2,4-diacetamido-2,4,6-trideoxy-beta-L-altropyranose hydrolase
MNATHHHSLRVAFRTDASIQIGTGHVMRCLTLADALAEKGAGCLFISRAHEGNLNEMIVARGHPVLPLPADRGEVCQGGAPAHGHWLGTSWKDDAQQTLQVLDGTVVDWLVADHYALEANWEAAVRHTCRRMMVIDDLADRSHDCDLLLDQNLGRRPIDYADLIPRECSLLVGPKYALLRPEFVALRAESLTRRRGGTLEHLLITLGGVDKDNVTGKVLDALAACYGRLPSTLQISVIMGTHAPWRDQVQEQAKRMPWPTQVAVGVSDMARRMADADLIIGAAGSSSWERCCLGVPTIICVLAENQQEGALALQQTGAAIIAQSAREIGLLLEDLTVREPARHLEAMCRAARMVVDGHGATIVARRMLEDNV